MSKVNILDDIEVHGNVESNHIYAETYRTSRSDGDIYIQAATSSDFVSIGTEGGNNLLRVQGDGKVGIGAASPTHTLEVKGNTANTFAVRIDADYTSGQSYGLRVRGGTNSVDSALLIEDVSGNDLLNVKGSGTVGIGGTTESINWTDSPTLTVEGAAPVINLVDTDSSADDFNILNDNGKFRIFNDTDGRFDFNIDGSGNVGIGAASPSAKLDVSGTVAGDVQLKVGNGSTDASAKATLKLGSAGGNWLIENRRSGGKLVFVEGSSDVVTMDGGKVGINIGSPSTRLHIVENAGSAQLTLERTGGSSGKAVLAGAASGFIVYDDAYGPKMYVGTSGSYNGRVGIATISPSAKIHVNGGTDNLVGIFESTDTLSYISFKDSSTTSDTSVAFGASGDNMTFYTGTSYGTERMRITSAGNVSIGTSTPFTTGGTAKLTIASGVISFGASNSDMSYLRRTSTGNFQWQTYNNGNTGNIHLQPYGGNVGIGLPSPTYKLDILGSGAIQRIRTTTSSQYAETHFENDNNQKLVVGSIGSTYSNAAWAGMRYIYSTSGDLAIKSAAAIRFYGNTLGTGETARITSTGIGINTTSPAAKLDVQPDSNGKITKFGNDVMTQYKMTGLSNHTLTLTCGSYYQAEVIITANQTNGGEYNNLYIRGIWHNNHESHHWEEIEHIGLLSGSSFTITVSQNTTSNSGKLVIQHNYSSASFAQAVIRVTDFYNTHSYTLT